MVRISVRPRSSRSRDFVVGVYPLLPDETCRFLAADFDGESWARDAVAYLETCRIRGVSAALERSRSGKGGHVWIFFAEPIPAREARQLGAMLITATMERRPEIGFASYDRLFPSQDTMPAGGFGNLIALPLQRQAREQGNSLFVDDDLHPFDDQWTFLSSLRRVDRATVAALVVEAETRGPGVLGVRMPAEDEDADEPWLLPPSRRRDPEPITGPLPDRVEAVLADGIYIDRSGLPAADGGSARARCRVPEPRVLPRPSDATVHLWQAAHHLLCRTPSASHRAAEGMPRRGAGAAPVARGWNRYCRSP